MKRKSLRDILDRVETWPKEEQEAAYDSLSAIEEDLYGFSGIDENNIRSREDIKLGRLMPRDDI